MTLSDTDQEIRFDEITEIEGIEQGGNILRARIDSATYDLDDDDEDSLISRLKLASGHDYQWRNDYEPQPDGTATVTLERLCTTK